MGVVVVVYIFLFVLQMGEICEGGVSDFLEVALN